jgi:predicted aldo/keto reductase-like oxidoreductase
MPVEHHDLAFRYALSLPKVCCAVIGMATRSELEQNVGRARSFEPLSAGQMRQLRDAGSVMARQWNDHLGPVT